MKTLLSLVAALLAFTAGDALAGDKKPCKECCKDKCAECCGDKCADCCSPAKKS